MTGARNNATEAAERVRSYLDGCDEIDALNPDYPLLDRIGHLGWDDRPSAELTRADLRAVLADNQRMREQIDGLRTEWAFQYTSYGITETSLVCDSREQAEQEAGHHRNGDRIVRRLAGEWQQVGDGPELQTPETWCERYNLEVRDTDGWRGADALPWETPITLPDFWRRYGHSTARIPHPDDYARILADVKAARQQEGN